jgi:hypothetical protein
VEKLLNRSDPEATPAEATPEATPTPRLPRPRGYRTPRLPPRGYPPEATPHGLVLLLSPEPPRRSVLAPGDGQGRRRRVGAFARGAERSACSTVKSTFFPLASNFRS